MLKAFLVCLGHLIGIFFRPFIFYTKNMGMWFRSSPWDCAVSSKKKNNSFESFLCFLVFLQPISNADFIVPVEIDGTVHQVLLHWFQGLPDSEIIRFPFGSRGSIFFYSAFIILCDLTQPRQSGTAHTHSSLEFGAFSLLFPVLLFALKIDGPWRGRVAR